VTEVTSATSNTIVGGAVLPQTDGTAKIKLNAIAAEVAGTGTVATVLDIYALGY
jgi:hypothetical protein